MLVEWYNRIASTEHGRTIIFFAGFLLIYAFIMVIAGISDHRKKKGKVKEPDPAAAALAEARLKRKTIVKTKILDVFSEYTTQKEGVAGRALIGGIIAGPIGALAGASSAGSRTYEHRKTRFMIWYADGHTAVKVVRNDSMKYLELVKYLE